MYGPEGGVSNLEPSKSTGQVFFFRKFGPSILLVWGWVFKVQDSKRRSSYCPVRFLSQMTGWQACHFGLEAVAYCSVPNGEPWSPGDMMKWC